MNEVGAFAVAILGVIATLASVAALFVKSRGENKNASTNAKTALDARIDERMSAQMESAWKKLDELSLEITESAAREIRKNGAITRILRAIANQWPDGRGPDLHPDDIAEIEETIPSQWLRKKTV